MKNVTCPDCKGAGGGNGFMSEPNTRPDMPKARRCAGSGLIAVLHSGLRRAVWVLVWPNGQGSSMAGSRRRTLAWSRLNSD